MVREVNAKTFGREAQMMGEDREKWQVSKMFADDTALIADSEEQLRRRLVWKSA